MLCALPILWITLAASLDGDARYDAAVDSLQAQIEARPANRALAEAVARRLAEPPAPPPGGRGVRGVRDALRARLHRRRIVLLRVPGLMYRSNPQTGADLEVVGEALGGAEMIATDEVGTVEGNARKIAHEVSRIASDGRRVALISASKGSADVRQALEGEPELGPRVVFWIDLVGVLEGTPLLDGGGEGSRVARTFMSRRAARSLSHSVRTRAARPDRFPAETRAVHLAAFPRIRDFSRRARPPFELLRAQGPNDGYVMLDSYLRAPGRVLIVRGSDHYLRSSDPERAKSLLPRLAALVNVLLDELGPPGGDAVPLAR